MSKAFRSTPGGPELVVDVRFADDGRTILVSVTPDAPTGPPPYLRRYEARTGRSLGPGVRIGRRAAGVAPTVPSRRDRLLLIGPEETFVVDAATLRVRRRIPVGGSRPGPVSGRAKRRPRRIDGSVAILDLRTGERRTLAGRHEDRVRALAFSADGRTLATTAGDGRVLVWDLRSGEVRETLTGHTGAVNTLEVSDDGHTLYTAGLDGRIIVWDIAGDRRLARPFRAGDENGGYPPPLAISPSGRTVAAGLPDGGVRLHDARTLRRLRDLPGIEDGPVAAVEFSPGGRSIAVRAWRARWSYATRPAAAACARRCASAHRHRRWHSRPMAAASRWRTSRATCGCWTWVAARCARARGWPAFRLTCPTAPMAGCSRSGSTKEAPSCATVGLLQARRSPVPQRRRGAVGGFASRRMAGCWPSPPPITRSCGTWPSAGESARR